MKNIVTFFLLGILLTNYFAEYSFAEDPTSPPLPSATSQPLPSNTPQPLPTNTIAPQPSNTSVPAPSNTPVPASTNEPTKAPLPTTNLNKVVKITKTIPPTLDPEEMKLLAITTTESEVTISPTLSATPTPAESISDSRAFKLLPFLFLIALILGGAFGYNNYKKTGQWFPENWKEKFRRFSRQKNGRGLRRL